MAKKEIELDKYHIAILRILCGLSKAFYWIPFSKICEKCSYPKELIKEKLRELVKAKYAMVSYVAQYKEHGFRITHKGLDALCIWDYKKHNIIKEVCTVIGEGKEAKIVSAISPEGEWLIIKFHRYYALEFRKIRKSLNFAAIYWRIKQLKIEDYMIDVPRAKAQIEYYVLNKLKGKYPVPEPVSINRHSVVMKMICDEPGIPAKDLRRVKLVDPEVWYKDILETYNQTVEKEKIVHGDLGPDNILITKDGEFYFIDWPQAVPKDFSGAKELYERDIKTIKEYFEKEYGIKD